MADFNTIKTTIDANINTNGNQAITGAVMNSVLKQMVDSTDSELTKLSAENDLQKLESGNVTISGGENANVSLYRSNFIPCKVGDVITAPYYKLILFDDNFKALNIQESSDGHTIVDYTIENTSCRYVRVTILKQKIGAGISIQINGVGLQFAQDKVFWQMVKDNVGIPSKVLSHDESISVLEASVREIGLQTKPVNIPFTGQAYKDMPIPFTLKMGMVISEIVGTSDFIFLKRASDGEYTNIKSTQLPYTILEDITAIQTAEAVEGYITIADLTSSKKGSNEVISEQSYIALPIPELAKVDISSIKLPTTKTDDIRAIMTFDDGRGNIFQKNIIINAQGNSSLGFAKKNFSIDIFDGNFEDSHELKFGNWVSQDSFHLKGYMRDGMRIKSLVAYDLYESILLTRGVKQNRAWKRLLLPQSVPSTSNEITTIDLQLDNGAKCHPSGFPIILTFNGAFYGIYCWQLKKHRKNYHQDKKNSAHIHLDGNISNTLLWEANGTINWDKWSGKEPESDTINNVDGIEVRNPKPLILVDGTEYDGDTNRGELMSKASSLYDSTNKDMKRTAEVRESLELLSANVARVVSMEKGEEKKNAIAEIFDVDSIIDYIIFGQITGNIDGYKKNWQWVTYDGTKWAVNAYDLDYLMGWSSWSYYAPAKGWVHNDTPPISLVIENYSTEIFARYAELRQKGIIDIETIMEMFTKYIQVVGEDYFEQEFTKWSAEGARDNLWRFETWLKEAIANQDKVMGYNVA